MIGLGAMIGAWTLSGSERRWPQWLSGLGVALCALLAVTLPLDSVGGGAMLLLTGSHVWLATRSGRAG